MGEKIMFAMVFGTFLFFCFLVLRRYKAQPTMSAAEAQLNTELLNTFKAATNLDNFLKGARYFQQIATVQDKPVYKYIYNNGFLYEFKDFLPRDKKVFLMNEEALSFDYMYYERTSPTPEFVAKHLVSIVEKPKE